MEEPALVQLIEQFFNDKGTILNGLNLARLFNNKSQVLIVKSTYCSSALVLISQNQLVFKTTVTYQPVRGFKFTFTFSWKLNIPTEGRKPPNGSMTLLTPTIVPFLVKKT